VLHGGGAKKSRLWVSTCVRNCLPVGFPIFCGSPWSGPLFRLLPCERWTTPAGCENGGRKNFSRRFAALRETNIGGRCSTAFRPERLKAALRPSFRSGATGTRGPRQEKNKRKEIHNGKRTWIMSLKQNASKASRNDELTSPIRMRRTDEKGRGPPEHNRIFAGRHANDNRGGWSAQGKQQRDADYV